MCSALTRSESDPVLNWSSATWKSSCSSVAVIGGGSGTGFLGLGTGSGRVGVVGSGSGNFHWVKLCEVAEEEEEDSEDSGGGGGGGAAEGGGRVVAEVAVGLSTV